MELSDDDWSDLRQRFRSAQNTSAELQGQLAAIQYRLGMIRDKHFDRRGGDNDGS